MAALSCSVVFGAAAQPETTPPMPPVANPQRQADEMYYDATKARIKGDDKEAEQLLQQVIRLKPDAAGAYYDLARLSMKTNSADRATGYIKKAIDIDATNPWYKSEYAEILVLGNKFDEAADIYTKLAKDQKYNQDYLLKSAMLYQHTGKYKEALASLNKILEREPDDEELLMQKQQIYLKLNDVNGAAAVLQQLISLNSHEGKYYALLAEMYDNNNQHDKATEAFKKAEAQFPNDPYIQLSLANYYKKQKDIDKYHEYARKAIANKGLDAEQQIAFLIDYMRELGTDSVRIRQALEVGKEITEQHKDNAIVLGTYGDILSLNGETAQAVEQYKKSIAIDPSHYQVWQNLLYNFSDKKDADTLLFYTDKALRLFPNQAMLHYFRAIALFNKKDYSASVRSMNRAVDMQPEDNPKLLGQMYSMLGDIYNTLKQYDLSDTNYNKALRLDPDDASMLNNYSYYLSLRGTNLAEAEKMSKHSLDLRPGEATFMDTYGWILFKEGKYEKAREYIQKAIDANPVVADGTLFEHIGDVYYKLNNTDKAVEYWQKAKDKGTENPAIIDKKIKDRKLYE